MNFYVLTAFLVLIIPLRSYSSENIKIFLADVWGGVDESVSSAIEGSDNVWVETDGVESDPDKLQSLYYRYAVCHSECGYDSELVNESIEALSGYYNVDVDSISKLKPWALYYELYKINNKKCGHDDSDDMVFEAVRLSKEAGFYRGDVVSPERKIKILGEDDVSDYDDLLNHVSYNFVYSECKKYKNYNDLDGVFVLLRKHIEKSLSDINDGFDKGIVFLSSAVYCGSAYLKSNYPLSEHSKKCEEIY